jgi:hypothetical protein
MHGSGSKIVYRVWMVKPEGKRLLERPGHRWEDGIRMAVRDIGWGCAEWIHWLRIGTGGRLS